MTQRLGRCWRSGGPLGPGLSAIVNSRGWTELFFLDEAVALAAGHRPCFLCRRDAAKQFKTFWMSARGVSSCTAAEIDDVLHAERLVRGRKRLHPLDAALGDLPDGTVVAVGGYAFTLHRGQAYRWTNDGYEHPQVLDRTEWMVTPPATVAALAAGYRPVLHPSINATSDRPDHV
jgi:hypothetical protein